MTRASCALVFTLGALVAGCGGKSKPSEPAADGSVKGGPGVTAKQIRLGVLTDLSGVFGAVAQPVLQGTQLYWKQRNAEGGVCGRTIELIVKDHGYDPQKAVVQYRDLGPRVAALQQLLGSPITAALLPSLKSDSMLSIVAASASSLLPNPFIIQVGTTYDIEIINGLDKLLEDGKIAKGDKIGHIYFEGEYGENGLAGSRAFAKANGLTVVEQKIKATEEDMAGPVGALKAAGVKAIALSTGPVQLAAVAGLAAAQGLPVPIVGNNATWSAALLETPAADALKANAYVVGSVSPYNVDALGPKAAAAAYEGAETKPEPTASIQLGWAQGAVMQRMLQAACDAGDLSREGLVEAARTLSDVDLEGLTAGPMDFTKVGEPSTRRVYIARPADVPGGLKSIGTFESDGAREYDVATR